MTSLSPDAWLAARLMAEGDLAGALCAAQAGLQAEPGNAPLWNLLGVCAARLAQPPLAEQCWRQALTLDSATPDAHYNLGCLRAEQGDAAQAEAHYAVELARDPGHASCLGNLGNLLQDAGRLDEAEACFRRRLAAHPSAAAHYQLGRLLRQRGQRDEAVVQLRTCLDADADDVEALQLLGQLLAERSEAAEAETLLRRALALAPGHLAAGNNLGILLMARRRWDEAEAWLRGAYDRQPDAALPNLAALLCATGRAAAALICAAMAASGVAGDGRRLSGRFSAARLPCVFDEPAMGAARVRAEAMRGLPGCGTGPAARLARAFAAWKQYRLGLARPRRAPVQPLPFLDWAGGLAAIIG
ncbi:hypothetical protein DK842_04875 [Chromobacterium phragmitis]|uniref:tetratricopeptide repeat protein n=1 Tax=Chromobacterium phragmitis TaxID=2202141 RepID=UPI000DED23B6|nr:tetratricopeptide repeat protein [Chromobacterium phragmitis]AXE29301.1 hypothetical protein DK842_04875 [Chromobacterium phragmitis]